MSLAALKDIGSSNTRADIPRRADLLELLRVSELSPGMVLERWRSSDMDLSAVIGSAGGSTLESTFAPTGPTALSRARPAPARASYCRRCRVAGDRASARPARLPARGLQGRRGVQGMREAAAHGRARHRPRRPSDAARPAFAERRAPAARARPSRRRREDLADLEQRDPTLAPPSLLIVIDEFATLAKEVPDFVEGIVDVAQRGRSLGVHLLLATQRPGGVVSETSARTRTYGSHCGSTRLTKSGRDRRDPDAARIPRAVSGPRLPRTGTAS